jgi:hypothetical protein
MPGAPAHVSRESADRENAVAESRLRDGVIALNKSMMRLSVAVGVNFILTALVFLKVFFG